MSDIIYTSQQETNRQERFQKFLLRAKDCHKEKFSYTDEYINARTPITIICKVHGPFHQTPDDHVTSLYCCPVCSQDQRSKTKISKKANTFVLRARRVHGSKYEYDKTEYVGNHKQVSIGCRIHGSFQQQASDHLQGKGCPKCKRVGSYSFEYFFYNQPRRNQQGLLYLVKIDDGQHCFLKIGITRRTLRSDFAVLKM